MYTKQQTFNTVIRHLRKQRVKSTGVIGCAYRGDDGTKCAVGVLVPDGLYSPDMEGASVSYRAHAKLVELIGHDVILCSQLQRLHDSHIGPCGWNDRSEFVAECIAGMHGVRMPEVEQ